MNSLFKEFINLIVLILLSVPVIAINGDCEKLNDLVKQYEKYDYEYVDCYIEECIENEEGKVIEL